MSLVLYRDGPTLTVELGLNALPNGTYAVWDSAEWDDTQLWGPDLQWTDITAYLRSASTFLGRSREDDRYHAATFNGVFDNTDARFTPGNLTGPYVAAGVTQLRPKVPIRLRLTYNAVQYFIFYGLTTSWQDNFPASGKDAVTTISAVDPLSLLSAFNGVEQSPQGAGETSGLRMHRILSNAGWTLATDIDPGVVTVQETTLAGNAITEIDLTADSEGGAVWCDPDGTFVFEQQDALTVNTRSTASQATFSPAGGGDTEYQDPIPAYDDTLLRTIVRYARAGGTQQTARDLAAIAQYGEIDYTRNDLICETDDQVATLTALHLERWKAPEYRVVSIVLNPRRRPTVAWPQALGRRIRDRVTVTMPVPVSSFTMSNQAFIDGVAHSFDTSNWQTTFYFASATAYDDFSASLWDTAIWDTSVFV